MTVGACNTLSKAVVTPVRSGFLFSAIMPGVRGNTIPFGKYSGPLFGRLQAPGSLLFREGHCKIQRRSL